METVLIIEENRQLSNLYRCLVTRAGFRVIQAYSCAGALNCLRNERPVLVLLDTALSDGSSALITNYLQSNSEFVHTCIDLISGDICYKSQLTFHKLLKLIRSDTHVITLTPLH